jgi:hypothetical protein
MELIKKYAVFLIWLTNSFCLISQPTNDIENRTKKFNKENLRFGGNIGLNFGLYTYFELTPTISYLFTDKFAAGAGLTYIYYKYNDLSFPYETSIFGGSLFERFYITENIFQHAELEILNYEVPSINITNNQIEFERKFVPALNVGAGYQSAKFMRGTYIMFLYNVLYGVDSRTPNPYIFRVGFNF